MSEINEELDVPVWFSLLIIFTLLSLMYMLAVHEATKKQEERNSYLRDSFSRMSESPEIQKAYDEIQ